MSLIGGYTLVECVVLCWFVALGCLCLLVCLLAWLLINSVDYLYCLC